MKEGDLFENLLDGREYVVKSIMNEMGVLQSRKEDRQILTGVETLKTKLLYREKGPDAEYPHLGASTLPNLGAMLSDFSTPA